MIEKKRIGKWTLWVTASLVVMLTVAEQYKQYASKPTDPQPSAQERVEKIPLASWPKTAWPVLNTPKGARSELIPLPTGMDHITVIGDKYKLYSVFPGGRECWSFGTETCPPGVVLGNYVVNETSGPIIYAFVPR